MADSSTHESRSQALADEIRRFLLAVHTGGIATVVALAASLADNGVRPIWVVVPISLFLLGVVFAALSMFLAQHREIKRRDAIQKNQEPPIFRVLLWSWFWNWLSLGAFVVAALLVLWSLTTFSV
jgi:hypothetical protein